MTTGEKIENVKNEELEGKIEHIVTKIKEIQDAVDFYSETHGKVGSADDAKMKEVADFEANSADLFDRYAASEVSEMIVADFKDYYSGLSKKVDAVFGFEKIMSAWYEEKRKNAGGNTENLDTAYDNIFNALLSEDNVLREAKDILVKKKGGLNRKEYDKIPEILMNLKDKVFEMVRKRNGKETDDKEYVKKLFLDIIINSGAVGWALKEQKMGPAEAVKIEQLIKNMTRKKTEGEVSIKAEKGTDPAVVVDEPAEKITAKVPETPPVQEEKPPVVADKKAEASPKNKTAEKQYLWADQIEKSVYAASNRQELLDFLKTLKEVRLNVSQKDKNNKKLSELRKFRFPDYINKVILPVLEGKKPAASIPINSIEIKIKEILGAERAEKRKKEKEAEPAEKSTETIVVPEKDVTNEKPPIPEEKVDAEIKTEPIAEPLAPEVQEEVVPQVAEKPEPEAVPESAKEVKIEKTKPAEKDKKEDRERAARLSNYIESYQSATEKFMNLILDKKIIDLSGTSTEERMSDLKNKLAGFVAGGLEKSELNDKEDINFIIDKVINKLFS